MREKAQREKFDLVKIVVLMGTRPEVIKLAPLISVLGEDSRFEPIVVSTAQHREMLDQTMEICRVSSNHDLNLMRPNQSLSSFLSKLLIELEIVLRNEKPAMVLVQGDTHTAFGGALAAFQQQIAIGHVEAGLRSGDKYNPFPEEMNRRLISNMADLNFAPTSEDKKNLLKEDVQSESIYVTGNTVIDNLLAVAAAEQKILQRHLPQTVFAEDRRVLLVTAHRRESFGVPMEQICGSLVDIVAEYPEVEVVFPVHLNPEVRGTVHSILQGKDRIHLIEPLAYDAFVEAMSLAHLIITDSGGVQEEAPVLGKPVLLLRKNTERQEGIAAGVVRQVGVARDNIVQAVSRLLNDQKEYQKMSLAVNPYGDGHASERIRLALLHFFYQGSRPSDFSP